GPRERAPFSTGLPDLRQSVFVLISREDQHRLVAGRISALCRNRQREACRSVVPTSDRHNARTVAGDAYVVVAGGKLFAPNGKRKRNFHGDHFLRREPSRRTSR